MSSLIDIILRNNSTFYDNRSSRPIRIWPRIFILVVSSGFFAFFVGTPSDGVVSSVITVQSILVGFGFSVLFFLVSAEQEDESAGNSLEDKARRKRLNTISDELFFNISYYNMVTILSVILALMFSFDISNLRESLNWIVRSANLSVEAVATLRAVLNVLYVALIAFFYFAFLESISTFYRIVVRVNFYFTQKRKIDLGKRE